MAGHVFAVSPAEAYAAAHYNTPEKRRAHAAGVDTCGGTHPLCWGRPAPCAICDGVGTVDDGDRLCPLCRGAA